MRILVVSNLYPPEIIGGYEIQCSQAVDALRRRGHDVAVLTSIPRVPIAHHGQSHVLRRLHTPDVYSRERASIKSPFWEFEANLLNAENVFVLLEILLTWNPDVCYLWNLVALGGVGIVGAMEYLGIPWVWHLGDAVPALLCNFEGELPALGALMGARLSGRFIACSETVRARVERLVSIAGRTRILPNWIRDSQPKIEREYFDGGMLKLVFVGRLTEDKGIFLVLEMAALLVASGYEGFHLDIIGRGLQDEVAARVKDLGLTDHTSLLGWRPPAEVREHLRQGDLLVLPASADDSMPLAAIEAASEGCVPLLPWLSGVSEWLVEGVHCLKADRTAEGYAGMVRTVMDGEVDLGELARRSVRAVHESFDIEAVMPAAERELAIAAARRRGAMGTPQDCYRLALIGDALLRRHVLEKQP